MKDIIFSAYIKGQTIWSTVNEEEAQDLVEYALVIVLICLAATAGMSTLATGINAAMTGVVTKLQTYTGS
jgi:pilus assembly protein Flp/PilA